MCVCVCGNRWKEGREKRGGGMTADTDERLFPSFGLKQFTEGGGLHCQEEDDEDCSFSVSVQDFSVKVFSFSTAFIL